MTIVGYMGSGKSTVGRIVAGKLSWGFIDLDEIVAKRAGLAIPEIFARGGEPHFRNFERRELLDALNGPQERVIACGGGVIVDPRNRTRLMEVATVFLWEDTEILYRRTRGTERPLRGTGYEDFARRYVERLPYYLEVASLHIESEGRPPQRIADEIVKWFGATL